MIFPTECRKKLRRLSATERGAKVAHVLATEAPPSKRSTKRKDQRARRTELRVGEGLQQDLSIHIGLVAGQHVPEIMRLSQAQHDPRSALVDDVGELLERLRADPILIEKARVLASERSIGKTAKRVEVDMGSIDPWAIGEERDAIGDRLETLDGAFDHSGIGRLSKDKDLIEAPVIACELSKRAERNDQPLRKRGSERRK